MIRLDWYVGMPVGGLSWLLIDMERPSPLLAAPYLKLEGLGSVRGEGLGRNAFMPCLLLAVDMMGQAARDPALAPLKW